MRCFMATLVGISATVFAGSTTAAPAQEGERAERLIELTRCREVTRDADRLLCFDRAVAALEAAERTGEVVVLDRAQVRETNRQLFGFQITNPFAGRTDVSPEPQIEAIETTLLSASPSGEGKWLFRLADGSEWRQIDSGAVRFRNREGEPVRVRRASLGSYMLTISSSRAVRVRRQ